MRGHAAYRWHEDDRGRFNAQDVPGDIVWCGRVEQDHAGTFTTNCCPGGAGALGRAEVDGAGAGW